MAYTCEECGNDSEFERTLTITEPFTKDADGDWSGDHEEEEVVEVQEVVCTECGAPVY